MYRLRLLGGLMLEGPSGPLSGRVVQQKRLALLALLASSGDSGVTRDKLVGYMWPESDDERARHRLSDTLHVIRRALGEEAVLASGETLRLDPEVVWTDVRELEKALDRGEPQAAAELYGGPFLDGVYLGQALEFERWVDSERQRCAGLYLRALEALALQAEDAGEHRVAAGWWKRLAAQDPYDSGLVVRVMDALAAAGDVANALQHARAHELLLRQELEVELPADVQETIERLKTRPLRADAATVDAPDGAPAEAPSVAAPVEIRRPPRWRRVALAGVGAVVLGGALVSGWLLLGRGEPPEPGPVMVAVLPFENLGTSEDQYLADGITDAINTALSSLDKLGVTSRTSAYAIGRSEKTAGEIGAELGVQYILEGTVLRERPDDQTSRVRINPQLIKVADDTHLWAEMYEVALAEVFNVYSNIAGNVASALEITLLEQESLALQDRPTDNLEAYDYFLRAEDVDDTNIAIRLLERAVELDPDFAVAYARLGGAYLSLYRSAEYARTDFTRDEWRESLRAAKAAVDRALEIDPEEVQVRLASGWYYYRGEEDLDRALEEFRAAERLGGRRDRVYRLLGLTHRKRGELDEALSYLTKDVQYNPLSDDGWSLLGTTYMMLHRFAEAERCFERAIAIDPNSAVNYQWKGWLHLIWNGDKERARRATDEHAIVLGFHAPTGGLEILGRARYRILREYYEQDVLEGEGYDPMLKGLAFELVGDVERSRAYYESACAIWEPRVAEFPDFFPYHFILAFVYAELGRDAEAIQEAEAALRLTENVFLNRDHVVANAAEVFLLVGEHERALDLIEIALSNPGSYITPVELRIDPVWDPIREHARFQALLEQYE